MIIEINCHHRGYVINRCIDSDRPGAVEEAIESIRAMVARVEESDREPRYLTMEDAEINNPVPPLLELAAQCGTEKQLNPFWDKARYRRKYFLVEVHDFSNAEFIVT